MKETIIGLKELNMYLVKMVAKKKKSIKWYTNRIKYRNSKARKNFHLSNGGDICIRSQWIRHEDLQT